MYILIPMNMYSQPKVSTTEEGIMKVGTLYFPWSLYICTTFWKKIWCDFIRMSFYTRL